MGRLARDPPFRGTGTLVAFLLCAVLETERRGLRHPVVRDGPVATAGSQNVGDHSERRFDGRSVRRVAYAARKRLGALQRSTAAGLLHHSVHRAPVADLDRTRNGASRRQPLAPVLYAPPPPAGPEHSFLGSAVLPRFH